MQIGTKKNPSSNKIQLACHSYATTAIPVAAPEPANPMKCSDPILLAYKLPPTYEKLKAKIVNRVVYKWTSRDHDWIKQYINVTIFHLWMHKEINGP